jgi:hypothetical protein
LHLPALFTHAEFRQRFGAQARLNPTSEPHLPTAPLGGVSRIESHQPPVPEPDRSVAKGGGCPRRVRP